MAGACFALFWVQCVAGIAINAYNQIWLRPDITITDSILRIIVGTGPISLGAAANSILIALSAEGIMVLAAWVKKRQLKQGIEIGLAEGRATGRAEGRATGRAEGRAEERKLANARLHAWAKDAMEAQRQGRPIPFDELPIENDSESD